MDYLPTGPFAVAERPGIGCPFDGPFVLRSKAKSGVFLVLPELSGDRVVGARKKDDLRGSNCFRLDMTLEVKSFKALADIQR
jgi:hypothetical protein